MSEEILLQEETLESETELQENETELSEEETDSVEEITESVSDGDALEETNVSSGDNTTVVVTFPDEYISLLEGNNALLSDALQELKTQNMSIWEKPIDAYTTTEGTLVITMAVLLALIVFKIVGGIISCLT